MSDADTTELTRQIVGEMLDNFDEELEMELDDDRLASLLGEAIDQPEQQGMDRRRASW